MAMTSAEFEDTLDSSPEQNDADEGIPSPGSALGATTNLSASYTGSSSPTSEIGFSGQDKGRSSLRKTFGKSGSSSSGKSETKNKLERSRQSARECRARKKLRYQYLDDLIFEREKANIVLRDELIRYQEWCHQLDSGKMPDGFKETINKLKKEQHPPCSSSSASRSSSGLMTTKFQP